MEEAKFKIIASNLSPERPIRSPELLRGRMQELENIERELRYFYPVLFIYGHRGVGKTSLARTAAQNVTPADREHVYIACSPGSRFLHIFREIGEEVLKLIFKCGSLDSIRKRVELEISMNPAIRASFEHDKPTLDEFNDANAAVRVLKELDDLLPDADSTVVILDELEELNRDDRTDLAFFIKQLGDQEFKLRFILVGIAENVHELIGAHESVPRYLKEVSLQPLHAQDLIDVVKNAADAVGISVPQDILFRIAIIGNGFPHFAHLMGKALLTEAVIAGANAVTPIVYRLGVSRAVGDSIQELKISYEAATQRSEDFYKHLIWALANSEIVDLRIDEWIGSYRELAKNHAWSQAPDTKLRTAINNFKLPSLGHIIINTPARYGTTETRYRYKRFANMLMKGHVRLQAENEGIKLGSGAKI